MSTIAAPATPQPATATHETRELIVQVLADHHTATVELGGGLFVWVCLCGAPDPQHPQHRHGSDHAADHTTAYALGRAHTAQAVLDALAAAGVL